MGDHHLVEVKPSSLNVMDSPPPTLLGIGCQTAGALRFGKSSDGNTSSAPLASMQGYSEEVGQFANLEPQDSWLPITESRGGNAYYAAFHVLCSGIGAQALLLPLAFNVLGWAWGIACLSLAFLWQLYTLWLLVQLHESHSGMRYSRYLRLSTLAFGEKLGKLASLFPIMYLSGGTCVTLIMIGGGTLKILFELVCPQTSCTAKPLTTIEWYFLFTCVAILVAQLPNLNSLAGISLLGAVTAVAYCTLIWVVSLAKGRPEDVSYGVREGESGVAKEFEALNALGIVAFAFRGHNLALEIQGTMPSSVKCPSRVLMWKGVKIAYLIIAMCVFPLAIAGYWTYGNMIPASNEGLLTAMYKFHGRDTSKFLLCTISASVVINCLSSFQIYAMPVFDNLEFRYTSAVNGPCPIWLRSALRLFFGCLASFIAVALLFLPSLAGLFGGVALPITLAYPCFMWIIIKKPTKFGTFWFLNWILGVCGALLSVAVITGAIWILVTKGLEVHFLKPE